MNLTVTKERVLEAASKCSNAKNILKTLFPEVFEEPKPNYPLRRGDIYRHPLDNTNPFRLEKVVYSDERRWVLMGLGAETNSGSFFEQLHTTEEIAEYLQQRGMVYSHNVDSGLMRLYAK